MKALQKILLIYFMGIIACTDGGTNDELVSATAKIRLLPDDDEIMAKAYDRLYQVPEYFYVDERANTSRGYSLYHLKDVSMSYERCSIDFSEALEWETADNDSRSVAGYYVGSHENERYFEFIRELNFPNGVGNIAEPTSPGYARVFKCDYVDRNGVDRNLRDGYAGTLNMRPLSVNAIKTYAEYMWQFTFFWPARKLVLETFSSEQLNTYRHTLLLAFVTNQGADKCDLIEVVDWIFTVDKADGTITKDFRLLHQMEVQLVDGSPEKCGV